MLKKSIAILILIAFVFSVTGCYTNIHKVGNGPQGNEVIAQKQWYALWGLIPLGNVDTNAMAGGAANYEIVTTHSFIDIIIGCFTGMVTVYPKTVQVTK